MDGHHRALYGSLLFVFTIVWLLLLLHDQTSRTSASPRIRRSPAPARRFDYILAPGDDVCTSNDSGLLLVVYVHSAIEHRHRRDSIRATWASRATFGKHIRVLFMLGSSHDPSLMQQSRLEFGTYGDIVQQTFIDAYRNLTYKGITHPLDVARLEEICNVVLGIMALHWISHHCQHVPYVLKTDDDMLINMFAILNHLHTLTCVYPTEAWHLTIACLLWTRMRVTRDPTSKWFVSVDEYPYEHFASYCSGSAFFITQDLVHALFDATLTIPFFWIDDYYMTGLLPRALRSPLHVHYLYINSLFVVDVDRVEQRFLSPSGLASLAFAHMPMSASGNRLLHIWQHFIANTHSAHKYLNSTIHL